ncbi:MULTISPECIES: GNAT family N-acetyltransferase [unclassified Mesorhizobium]|uniref:GNAT family N-acetyltransferase n=1 Tax=unclassified Mesorhizobium TaxID=325217 RepID=UPI000FC9BE8C|nr:MULTISPECIES: GNAT family N-acetyltransferase [unclassified Mesorhizobium]TIT75304.1 MAG: GNAT family N-acetyltransferase [Mesorhizobium sp.]TGP23671.1 GNAT family N-acetyltransferase [Mesorhizobium sp. M1D.F.Ca.ET.231.01.1.1]TGP33815.1 GNAT family N-acetyltransferase [Mesorhizobium sp. M1D.F.Ca.ET.234.01.1.1]TGS47181.1 GNAT family N-acetyltransferase [Mesorhizobium sp. M1D.F.Ca.ET.184.01.1.1]TGS62439.1 GNAT family N-acetyltransferase [Mesorhizobium sp. M1D.F.Ca.ET.183.01.1.1]
MQPTIEVMAEGDVEAVARLRLAAFFEGSGRTLQEDITALRGLIAGDGFEAAFVARFGGSPIGSCLFVRNEIDPAHDLTPWLAGLVVDEHYRGRGVGAALLMAVEAHAASVGVSKLYLYTWQARRFYEALGWTALEAFEQEGEPMVLMARSL